jgi:GDP-4-dehydro-6-deoxy-D-mannose reductase
MLGLQYYLSDGLPIMRARPFNHFGPGQNERFVAPAFAMQIARIEAGEQEPIMHVGDLTAKRDFTDVRDIVRAYRLIVEKGQPGEAYNVASGRASSIRVLLDILLGFTQASIQVEVDEARLRSTKIPILQGDATRLREATGWEPMIPMEQTLQDVLDDARQRLRKQGAIAL